MPYVAEVSAWLTECIAQLSAYVLTTLKPWFHVKIKLFQRILVFYFNMEPRLYGQKEVRRIVRTVLFDARQRPRGREAVNEI